MLGYLNCPFPIILYVIILIMFTDQFIFLFFGLPSY